MEALVLAGWQHHVDRAVVDLEDLAALGRTLGAQEPAHLDRHRTADETGWEQDGAQVDGALDGHVGGLRPLVHAESDVT